MHTCENDFELLLCYKILCVMKVFGFIICCSAVFAVCSGMVNSVAYEEQHVDSKARDQRLKSLSNFQAMLLRHALKFPSVRRVVYSTCSIFEQENELVIHDVLQSKCSTFQLVDVLPMLPSRGQSSTLLQAESCVRLSPETTLTEGFFIACLERVELPPRTLSAAKIEVGGQSCASSVASRSTSGDVQIEIVTTEDGGNPHRRKKSKKEGKSSRVKRSKKDVTVVEEKSSLEVSGLSQESFIPELTSAEFETKHDTAEEKRILHKRKKSTNEKSGKVAKLEHSETDVQMLNSVQSLPDTVISDVLSAEQDTASDWKKSHKHKKTKQHRTSLEMDVTLVEEKLNVECDEQLQKNSNGKTSFVPELTDDVLEAENDTVAEKRKSQKRKKSKKEKAAEVAKLEHSSADVPRLDHVQSLPDRVICDHRKKSRKHKKSKKDKTARAERSETTGIDEERSEIKPDNSRPRHKSCGENMSCVRESTNDPAHAECDAVGESRNKRKKPKTIPWTTGNGGK